MNIEELRFLIQKWPWEYYGRFTADDIKGLLDEHDKLQAERDRYRKALEDVNEGLNLPDTPFTILQAIARAALESSQPEAALVPVEEVANEVYKAFHQFPDPKHRYSAWKRIATSLTEVFELRRKR